MNHCSPSTTDTMIWSQGRRAPCVYPRKISSHVREQVKLHGMENQAYVQRVQQARKHQLGRSAHCNVSVYIEA